MNNFGRMLLLATACMTLSARGMERSPEALLQDLNTLERGAEAIQTILGNPEMPLNLQQEAAETLIFKAFDPIMPPMTPDRFPLLNQALRVLLQHGPLHPGGVDVFAVALGVVDTVQRTSIGMVDPDVRRGIAAAVVDRHYRATDAEGFGMQDTLLIAAQILEQNPEELSEDMRQKVQHILNAHQ
ncbi:MAG: hypothetical protein LBJ70_01055 [Holosporales bacterium]|jgi:hypothetical protein|nr:hypothetical protein [Holosporales bacterium]